MKNIKPTTVDVENKIKQPCFLDIVTHGGLGQKSKKYPCDVVIESMNNDVWEWRRILSNLKLGKIEKGEGDFYKSKILYERKITTKKGKPMVKEVTKYNYNYKVDIPNSGFIF